MTMPPVVRVFFAVDLPMITKQCVETYLDELKKNTKNQPIRWTKIENLHITLHFIGQMHSEHVSQLITNVKTCLAGKAKPLTLTLGEFNFFPTSYRPRVLVLTLAQQAEWAALARLVGEGIVQTDYEIEKRPFRGHLTLGRIKQPKGLDLRVLSKIALPKIAPIVVSDIVLFRSEPLPEGSRYTVLERIGLE